MSAETGVMDGSGKLPLRTKVSLGLGTAAFGIKDQGFSALLMLYYNQVIGLPAAWVGFAIMLAMVVDAFADPLIGHWSDGIRTRWGRRHPFMVASALPMALGYYLLWSPPVGATHELLFVYLLLTSVCVRVAISLYEIPSSALTSELTSDYDERTSLSSYRTLFYALGLIGMGVVVFKVVMQATPENPVGQLNAAGYTTYGGIAAAVMFVCVLVATFGTRDRIPTLLVTDAESHQGGLRHMLADLRLILLDRALGSLLLCAFFFAIVGGLSTTLATYIHTYFWRFSSAQMGTIAGAAVFGLILAMVVAQLSKKFGKKNVAALMYLFAVIAFTAPLICALLGLMPADPGTRLVLLAVQNALMVMCVLAGLILVLSMVADVGDYFHDKTGRRIEGLMFSVLIMINKGVSGMGVFLSGIILHLVGFPENAKPDTIDPAIVNHLAWFYVIAMAAFCLGAVVCLSYYPITREMHNQILARLGKKPD